MNPGDAESIGSVSRGALFTSNSAASGASSEKSARQNSLARSAGGQLSSSDEGGNAHCASNMGAKSRDSSRGTSGAGLALAVTRADPAQETALRELRQRLDAALTDVSRATAVLADAECRASEAQAAADAARHETAAARAEAGALQRRLVSTDAAAEVLMLRVHTWRVLFRLSAKLLRCLHKHSRIMCQHRSA